MSGEMVRFALVGCLAVAVQMGVYQLLLPYAAEAVANTVAYVVSFALNFVLSTRYTFRVKASGRRALGFAFSHAVNYVMQTLALLLFLAMGVPPRWAQLPMFAVCVPLNFVLVRFFLKDGK